MARRRTYKKKQKSIILNKYKVGLWMIILGGLYFFSLSLAEWSPVFTFLTQYAKIVFWEIGLYAFFGLCIVVGVLILAKWYLMKLLIRQFIMMMVLLSAIFNFPILDWEVNKYEQFGGFLSWPVLWILDSMFWGQAIATKVLVWVLFITLISWILYSFNFSLPRLNVRLSTDEKPTREKKVKAVPASSRTQEKTIAKKINQAQDEYNETLEHLKPSQPVSKSLIKSLVKQKLEEKIQKKESDKKPKRTISFASDKPTFPVSIMESNLWQTTTIDENFLMEKARALQNKLLEFNVPITIEGFDIWPSIVQIKIKPEAGIKISTIEWLSNDIALSLRSKSLRIVAPIPGTDCVGIQLPNPKPSMVRLWDILSSQNFISGTKKSLTNLSLGKEIDGSIIIKSLESMPHLLVAWATWSGKSVWVNDFILSLMHQNTPSELKFLMVDPKQVELELYSGLPYMLAPIVTDSDKALKLLKWAVDEMESRYTLLKNKRVKNLEEYNAKIIWEKLYRIVFVIDELADMMMSGNKKEVENCITRIAQKARAVGIHLIVATQRPSVNVITGLIKANIPTRIAFGVVSEVDSRTIIGRKWAEDLVGRWDMLYIDPSTKWPIRIQAPFVDTKEIEKVVKTLKDKYMKWLTEDDIYNSEIIKILENKLETAAGLSSGNGDDEELIQQAIEVISQTRKASATLLQRKLNVWFARAARIMDALEERWIVWPQEWAKPRDIFI